MGNDVNAVEAGGELRRVQVWDLPVRIFHWVLLLLVSFSWWSGKEGGSAMQYHMWSGYAILTLVFFRLVWGFCGGGNARFTAFVRGPGAVLAYMQTLFARRAGAHLGHNPLGGWSVVLLLVCLAVQTGSGLFANDDIATEGPLGRLVSKSTSDLLTTVHAYNFYVLLGLVTTHIAAVLFYLLYKSENLVRPMVTGYKWRPADQAAQSAQDGSNRLAVLILAVAAGAVYLIVSQ